MARIQNKLYYPTVGVEKKKYHNTAESKVSNEEIYDSLEWMNSEILGKYNFQVVLKNEKFEWMLLFYTPFKSISPRTSVTLYKCNDCPTVEISGTDKTRNQAKIAFEHLLMNEGLLGIKLEEKEEKKLEGKLEGEL